jgi:hypothetical protein
VTRISRLLHSKTGRASEARWARISVCPGSATRGSAPMSEPTSEAWRPQFANWGTVGAASRMPVAVAEQVLGGGRRLLLYA